MKDQRPETRDQRQKKIFVLVYVFLVSVLLISFAGNSFAQDGGYELVIKVKPNIIALPGNFVIKVPVNAARIRSTDLRELNNEYNATTIEKLFKLKASLKSKKELNIKGFKDVDDDSAPIDLNSIFTKEIKKQKEKEGKKVVEVANTFLIKVMPKAKVKPKTIVKMYKRLEAVKYAEYIVRADEIK